MKDMYDRYVRVYFFCMVLSYSGMRFVYFSREPFRTKTAIEAHYYAFRFFGGRTQTILYDQDKVFVILGKCDTGKITLAAHIGQMALDKKEGVYYCNIEKFLRVIGNKDASRKTEKIYRYMLDCSVIIIDDVMYANILPDDLPVFYRAASFLNESRSIVIITNRELSAWISAAEDTHLMQTLVDRITANSQIIRLG